MTPDEVVAVLDGCEYPDVAEEEAILEMYKPALGLG